MGIHMSEARKQFNRIDILKLVMAIFVVAIHTNPFIDCNNQIALKFFDTLLSLAVPYFFVCTGFLMSVSFSSDYSTSQNQKIVKCNIVKYLKMYLIWTGIYLPLAIIHYIESEKNWGKIFLSYLKELIFDGQHYNSWMLWYLLSTVYALLMILFLMKVGAKEKMLFFMAFLFLIVRVVLNQNENVVKNNPDNLSIIRYLLRHYLGNGRIFMGLYFIPLGILIGRISDLFKEKLRYEVVGGSCVIIGYIVNWYTDKPLLIMFLTAIEVCGLLLLTCHGEKASSKNEKYILIRKMSSGVYFIHLYVWTLYYTIVYGTKTFGLDSFLVTLTISLALSAFYYGMQRKIKTNRFEKK